MKGELNVSSGPSMTLNARQTCDMCFFPISVIYHYCVIVEMFCIGLYARHTFRKVEPSMMAHVGEGVGVQQMEMAVQTDDYQTTHYKFGLQSEEAEPNRLPVSASNLAYNSDSEESLCRIEHAPLDGFPFPQAKGQQHSQPEAADPKSAGETPVDVTHVTVMADINYLEDATIV